MALQSRNQFVESAVIEAATCAARKATFLGRQFRVVPAVLVRAQVLRNNLGATFLPAEEITDDWAAQWNGIPVLVGPHPSMQGVASSGRTPEIWNERGAGWIFHARAENGPDGTRRLVGEVWLDESRAAAVPGLQAVLARLDINQPVELSTGFGVQADEQMGVHNGETYELVLHPSGADHLVISTEMTGACAVADGCGLGANAEDKGMAEDKDKQTVEPVAEQNAGGNQPMQSVGGTPHPAEDFAYAPSGAPATDWKLPIFDAEHVRAALARFNQTDLPSEARTHVWRRVLAAADKFHITVSDRTMPGHNEAQASRFKTLLGKVAELFGKAPAFCWDKHETTRVNREIATLQLSPSDDERRQMLREALQAKFGSSDREVIVCDVYTAPEQYVIFWFMTAMGPMPSGAEYYQMSWVDADGDGIPELSGTQQLVRKMTSYEPVGAGPAGDGVTNVTKEEPAPAAPVAVETEHAEAAQLVAAITGMSEQVRAASERLEALRV